MPVKTGVSAPGTIVPIGALLVPGGIQGVQGVPGTQGVDGQPGPPGIPGAQEVGSIKAWPSVTPPQTWMVMDGSVISRTLYPDLFTLIGTTYGAGDGSTTFGLPDARSRFIVAAGQGASLSNRVLGAVGGEENHVLVTAELASHTHSIATGQFNHSHTISDPGHSHILQAVYIQYQGLAVGSGGNPAYPLGGSNYSNAVSNTTGITGTAAATLPAGVTAAAGTGTGHNNMPPFLVMVYIIKVSAGGGPTAQAPIADQTQPGLMNALSGNASDYVAGDNNCYPLPLQFGGRLRYVSTTQLSFLPFNGSQILISGVIYNIPSAGIVGLANTGVYIDGVVGNLAASTLYRVYCFNNGGTLTAEFSTTGHVTSATAGNVGTETKSGDDSRTFIGLILTNASSVFTNTAAARYVRSWVNRDSQPLAVGTSGSFTATTSTETTAIANFLAFDGETLTATGQFYGTASASTNFVTQIALDGTVASTSACTTTGTTAKYENTAASFAWIVSGEGQHRISLYANCSAANTVTGNYGVYGRIG